MIGRGDKVVCVAAEYSTCDIHNLDNCGPDPCPEMVGKVYVVAKTANWAKQPSCVGLIVLTGDYSEWCVGCFRKIDKADNEFITSLRVKELT